MTHRQLVLLLVLSLESLVACGKSAETSGADSPESRANEPGAPGLAWSQKTHQQRLDWMRLSVLPKMTVAFQTFDSKGFADFNCQTCHGEDMEAVGFKMPNRLPPLPRENTIAEAMEYDTDTAKLMKETIVPTMAKLLDTEPYDPKTGKGLGCFACHPPED